MNERIRELAEQASYRIIETDSAPIISNEFDKEKFAELIVEECLDLLWNSLSISADHVGTVDGIEYTGKEILTAAKEHFFLELKNERTN